MTLGATMTYLGMYLAICLGYISSHRRSIAYISPPMILVQIISKYARSSFPGSAPPHPRTRPKPAADPSTPRPRAVPPPSPPAPSGAAAGTTLEEHSRVKSGTTWRPPSFPVVGRCCPNPETAEKADWEEHMAEGVTPNDFLSLLPLCDLATICPGAACAREGGGHVVVSSLIRSASGPDLAQTPFRGGGPSSDPSILSRPELRRTPWSPHASVGVRAARTTRTARRMRGQWG